MRDIHLRINYWADDRFDVVSKTIIASYPYFKSIRLVNIGPDANSDKFIPFTKKIPHLSISNFGKYYIMCETEDILRSHFADIPDGDWGIWLDSDWRLPEAFLKNMQKYIEECESEAIPHIFSVQMAHHIGEGAVPTFLSIKSRDFMEEDIQTAYAKVKQYPEQYGWPLLQKITKKNIFTSSQLGNHPHILQIPYKFKTIPEMIHFHFRDYNEKAYNGSIIYLAWWYIGHHVFTAEEQRKIQKSEEYRKIEEFKHKHKCYTSTQLHHRIKSRDVQFIEELKQIFLSFKDTEIFTCQHMYKLANNGNMVFYDAPPEPRCSGICCEYNGKNIHDLAAEFLRDL
jgi:hypothetical protein